LGRKRALLPVQVGRRRGYLPGKRGRRRKINRRKVQDAALVRPDGQLPSFFFLRFRYFSFAFPFVVSSVLHQPTPAATLWSPHFLFRSLRCVMQRVRRRWHCSGSGQVTTVRSHLLLAHRLCFTARRKEGGGWWKERRRRLGHFFRRVTSCSFCMASLSLDGCQGTPRGFRQVGTREHKPR